VSEGATTRVIDLLVAAVVAGGAAALATIAINTDCFHNQAEVAVPQAGTQRAGWCGALTGGSHWRLLFIGAAVLLAIAVQSLPIDRLIRWALTGLVCVAALLVALVLGGLEYTHPAG
jgi:hypothetical protein